MTVQDFDYVLGSTRGQIDVLVDTVSGTEPATARTVRAAPTAEEICGQLSLLMDGPTGLGYGFLPDGTTLLCAATAPDRVRVRVGQVPTGPARPGHRLLPVDNWPFDWPGDRQGGAAFNTRATGDPAGSPPDPDPLVGFARQNRGRLAPFLADVRRLFADPAGRRLVLAEPDEQSVACWVAIACAALPVEYARTLTFTTRAIDPRRVPQQIVGIGPDTEFDRLDAVVREHLFRVYDGLGGPGSPAVPDDGWAELAAQLWCEGRSGLIPDPAPTEPPFRLAPLARRALEAGTELTGRAAESVVSWALAHHDQVLALPGTACSRLVSLLAEYVAGPGAPDGERDSKEHDALVDLCVALAQRNDREPLQPLAIALAAPVLRRGAAGSDPAAAATLRRLPLLPATVAALRAEWGERMRDVLIRQLSSSPETWAGPLLLLDALDGLYPLLARVAQRVRESFLDPRRDDERGRARDILGQARPELADAVLALLEESAAVDLIPIQRFAASAAGVWLDATGSTAVPPRLRMVRASVVRRSRPRAESGHAAFAALLAVLTEEERAVPGHVRTAWELVWPDGATNDADVRWAVENLSAEVLSGAGLDRYLIAALRSPGKVGLERAELAGRLLADNQFRLTESDHRLAELLVGALEISQSRVTGGEAVDHLNWLLDRADGVPQSVRRWSTDMLALYLYGGAKGGWRDRGALLQAAGGQSPELLASLARIAADQGVHEQVLAILKRHPERLAGIYALLAEARHGKPVKVWTDKVGDRLYLLMVTALQEIGAGGEELVHRGMAQETERVQSSWQRWWDQWSATTSRSVAEGSSSPGDNAPGRGHPTDGF
jgi:hypothetical protein